MSLSKEFENQGNFLFKRRGWLPIYILGAAVALYLVVGPTSLLPTLACLAISLTGLFIRVYAVGYSADHTSGRNINGQKAATVNTTGAYSIVRHPLYLGNYLMWLGIACLVPSVWFMIAFTLLFWLYYERIMFAEEQYLIRKFGKQYTVWASAVPAFVPNPSLWITPSLPFAWSKILRQEKNGILALGVLFFAFQCVDQLYFNSLTSILKSWQLIFLVAASLFYVLGKIEKKRYRKSLRFQLKN